MPLDTKFYNTLREIYEGTQNGKKAWEEEEETVRDVLEVLGPKLAPRYVIESPINIGGTAIVLRISDTNLSVPRALKLSRPLKGKEILLKRIIESEIARLIECTHPNIVSVFEKGDVALQGITWPYYVMEFLEGANDAKDWVTKKPDVHAIVHLLQQIVDGLVFLHKRGTVHCDVKLENILVLPDGQTKISDLGSARLLDPKNPNETILTCTRDFAHPRLREMLSATTPSDPNRVSGPIPRSKLETIFDLYSLGLNIFRIVDNYDVAEHSLLPAYERRYLNLMACRMLDGKCSPDNAERTGLPAEIFDEIKYTESEQVRHDLKKITGEYNLCRAIPELDHHFQRTIQASLPNSTPLTDRVAKFLASPYIRRLGGITQLGLIAQIYPTATHSRLEHVLGCFGNVTRYIDALWHDAANPFFRQVFNEHDVNIVLLASLCHDIGQYPLAHDLEEAYKDLFSHSSFNQRILADTHDKDSLTLRKLMHDEWEIEPDEVIALLNTRSNDAGKPVKQRFLSSLLDGPIDADKLDYLIRDSLNLNVPYGHCIDLERLLKCLTVVFNQQADKTFVSLGIHEKGKIPAEAVAFARYAMFGAVYWHHTSRSAKAMLHRAVWEAIPKVDKRTKEYQDFAEALWLEIVQEGRLGGRTRTSGYLFLPESPPVFLVETPQIAVSDYEILCWIHQHCSARGRQLIELLSKRHLFKRLLVISARKNQTLWERLTRMRKVANPSELVAFEDYVQKVLVRLLDKLDPKKRTSTILEKHITDEIVGRDDKGEILCLVDIPGERRGSPNDLYFLPEYRIHGPITVKKDYGEIEDSPIWNSLSVNFAASVGKIRVFCAPDFIATFTGGLDRAQIEGALASAADSISA
jgi:serine/threonine protein kinase